MSNVASVELYDDLAIKSKVAEVWEKVFSASNRVIQQANNYGFLGMGLIPTPNVHQMLVSLQIFSSVIDILVTNAGQFNVDYEETRLLLNAKEQITRMERIATALKANNKCDFDIALADLDCQAPF